MERGGERAGERGRDEDIPKSSRARETFSPRNTQCNRWRVVNTVS